MTMSTELLYLFLTSVLLTVVWIPHVVGQVKTKGPLRADEYVTLRDPAQRVNWVQRADRAHLNLVEQFGPFAGMVLVAHVLEISTAVTAGAAAVFFWSRIIHAIVMMFGISFMQIRTVIYTVAFIALLVFAWEIAAAKLF
jgi:uncharacterized MAPEG superfamily protein